jgi:hypothetical protein
VYKGGQLSHLFFAKAKSQLRSSHPWLSGDFTQIS